MDFLRSPSRRMGLVVGVIALALLCFRIGRPAYWLDEISTVALVRRDLGDLFRTIAGHEVILAPYYLLMKPWVAVSAAEWWVRLSSALAAATAAGLLAGWVYRRAGAATAVIAAAILLALPGFSRYGQEARPYGFLLVVTVLSAMAWWRLDTEGTRRAGWWYAASVASLPLVHLIAILLPSAHVTADLLSPQAGRRERTLRTVRWAVTGIVLASPLWVASALQAKGIGEPHPFTVATWLGMGRQLLGPPPSLLILFGLSALALLDLRVPERRRLVTLAVGWAYLPLILISAATLARPSVFTARYMLISLPGLTLAAALGCLVLGRLVARPFAALSARAAFVATVAGVLVPVVALAGLGLPRQQQIRQSNGHGDDARPLLELTRSPEYRDLPIAAPLQAQRLVEVYGPGLLPRLLIRQDAAAVGALSIEDVPAPEAQRRLAPYDQVLFLVWSPRPAVEERTRAGETQLAEFEPVREHRVRGWLLLLMERNG